MLEWLSEFRERNLGFARAANRFVVHVRDVHDAVDFVTAQLKMTLQQIFEDVGAKISNVRAAVNGRPASVHVDLARSGVARLELFELSRVSVKKANRHLKAVSSRAERGTSHRIARFQAPEGRHCG